MDHAKTANDISQVSGSGNMPGIEMDNLLESKKLDTALPLVINGDTTQLKVTAALKDSAAIQKFVEVFARLSSFIFLSWWCAVKVGSRLLSAYITHCAGHAQEHYHYPSHSD